MPHSTTKPTGNPTGKPTLARHACSLRLSIDGTRYRVRPGTTDDLVGKPGQSNRRPLIARPGWHLTKGDGTGYFVWRAGDKTVSCNCPGFLHARGKACRHVLAFQALGILSK